MLPEGIESYMSIRTPFLHVWCAQGWTITRWFATWGIPGIPVPHQTPQGIHPGQEVLRCLLQRLVQRTAALVAAWMAATWPEHMMNQLYI